MNNKYALTIAIHNGTLTSRDIADPKFFNSEEEAITEWQKARNWYQKIGYMIWFAIIIDPNGKEIPLESNMYI